MNEVLLFATVLAPIVVGLVEVTKRTFKLDTQYAPITALLLGIIAGGLADVFTDLGLAERLWAGALSGLASMGLFDLYKKM